MEEGSFHFFNRLEWLGFHCDASNILGLVVVHDRSLFCDIRMGSRHCGRQQGGTSPGAKWSSGSKNHRLRHPGYWDRLPRPHHSTFQMLQRYGGGNDTTDKVQTLPPMPINAHTTAEGANRHSPSIWHVENFGVMHQCSTCLWTMRIICFQRLGRMDRGTFSIPTAY